MSRIEYIKEIFAEFCFGPRFPLYKYINGKLRENQPVTVEHQHLYGHLQRRIDDERWNEQ